MTQSSYWSLYGGDSQRRGRVKVGIVQVSISIGMAREHVDFDKALPGCSISLPSQLRITDMIQSLQRTDEKMRM